MANRELREVLLAELTGIEEETRAFLGEAIEGGDESAAADLAVITARCAEARALVLALLANDEGAHRASHAGH